MFVVDRQAGLLPQDEELARLLRRTRKPLALAVNKIDVPAHSIRTAEFHDYAGPGDQLRYDAVIDSMDERAAATRGTVLKNGAPIGHVDLMFSHVNRSAQPLDLPDHNFVFTDEFMNLLKTFQRQTISGSGEADGG